MKRITSVGAVLAVVLGVSLLAQRTRPFATVNIADPRGIAVDKDGNLYVGDTAATAVHRITPDGKDSVLKTPEIQHLLGVAVDRAGNVLISDDHNGKIYRVDRTGVVASLIKKSDPAGLDDATTLVADSKGNVFVGDNHHGKVRKIGPDGEMTTFAAAFTSPRALAVDSRDVIYVGDESTFSIDRITPDGTVRWFAGTVGTAGSRDGEAKQALFGAPRGLAVDAERNLFVADTTSHTIRKVTPAGMVSTFAGQAGAAGFADGAAGAARFNQPRAIAVDANGVLYVADTGNHAVRMITRSGVVTTIAAAAKP